MNTELMLPDEPDGEPMYLLPTRMKKVRVRLDSFSHWDPLVRLSSDYQALDDDAYSLQHAQAELKRETESPDWQAIMQSNPTTLAAKQKRTLSLQRRKPRWSVAAAIGLSKRSSSVVHWAFVL